MNLKSKYTIYIPLHKILKGLSQFRIKFDKRIEPSAQPDIRPGETGFYAIRPEILSCQSLNVFLIRVALVRSHFLTVA